MEQSYDSLGISDRWIWERLLELEKRIKRLEQKSTPTDPDTHIERSKHEDTA